MSAKVNTRRPPIVATMLALVLSIFLGTRLSGAYAESDTTATGVEPTPAYTIPEGMEYVPGVVLVSVDEGTSAEGLAQRIADAGATCVDVESLNMIVDGVFEVNVVDSVSVEEAIVELESSGAVKGAEPNYIFTLLDEEEPQIVAAPIESEEEQSGEPTEDALVDAPESDDTAIVVQDDDKGNLLQALGLTAPNDPYAQYQWGLQSVHAYEAWQHPALANSATKAGIAVIDTGFQVGHPDLAGNVVATYNSYAASQDVTDPDVLTNAQPPIALSHGTHCAGIAGGVANNATGIAGVSGNNAQLVLIRAYNDEGVGVTTDSLLKALEYVSLYREQYSIRVISLSIGAPISVPVDQFGSSSILTKIDELYAKGVVTVCSGGNSTADYPPPFTNWPSDYETAVSVMNLRNNNDTWVNNGFADIVARGTTNKAPSLFTPTGDEVSLSPTSNYNRPGEATKDICAPGASILSTVYQSSGTATYAYDSGTSMAAPCVAGVLALTFAANPTMTADEAVNNLYSSTRDLGSPGFDETYGWGEVNAYEAVRRCAHALSGPTYVGVGSTGEYVVSSAVDGWTFASSDSSVLSVGAQSGKKVTATAGVCGTATLTATNTSLGLSTSLEVNVLGPLNATTRVKAGGSTQWSVKQPAGIGALAWDWKSSDGSVATVTSSGVVYGHKAGTATITATLVADSSVSFSSRVEVYEPPTPAAHVAYQTHVQKVGWQDWKRDGEMAGTSNRSLRLEGINIKLEGQQFPGSIEYRTHVQKIGWQGYVRDGAMSGTSGKSLRLEAIQIRLTGQMAQKYDVWYRVHAQTYGWMGWAKNDSPAGTAGYAKRLEAIEVRVLPKGSAAPGSQSGEFITKNGDSPAQSYAGHQVTYCSHVQSFGWRPYVCDGQMSGTTGLSKRLEGIKIKLLDQEYSGSIEYRTHVQKIGWQGYVRDDAMAGTSGKSLRLEAIQIRLTGQMAERFDVWYRVHAQTFGWMGWAKNDQQAGTAGYAKRLECLEVLVLPKGSPAPGTTANAFRQR